MIESTHDCGHQCCDERANPFHDHFLSAEACPVCERIRTTERGLLDDLKRAQEQIRRYEAGEA